MPSPRILDFGPNPTAEAFGKFGKGFSERTVQQNDQQQESDVLQDVLKNLSPSSNQEDVLKSIMAARGIGIDQKIKINGAISDVLERSRKKSLQQDLFGAGKPSQPKGDVVQDNAVQSMSIPQSQSQQSGDDQNVPFMQRDPSTWSNAQLTQLGSIDPNSAKTAIELKKSNYKEFSDNRKFESERSLPILKKIDEQRESIPLKENAIIRMKEAIKNKSKFSNAGDFLADLTGLEPLRSVKGSELVTASKEFLLGNIGRVGSRPNQWIEQQIAKMMPQAGRSEEANTKVAAMLEAEVQIQKKRTEVADSLSEAFQQSLQYVPGTIGKDIDKAMKPYEEFERDRLSYELKRIDEKFNGVSLRKVSQGTPLTLEMAKFLIDKYGDEKIAEKEAKDLGYSIPSASVYEEYLP